MYFHLFTISPHFRLLITIRHLIRYFLLVTLTFHFSEERTLLDLFSLFCFWRRQIKLNRQKFRVICYFSITYRFQFVEIFTRFFLLPRCRFFSPILIRWHCGFATISWKKLTKCYPKKRTNLFRGRAIVYIRKLFHREEKTWLTRTSNQPYTMFNDSSFVNFYQTLS